MDRGRRVNDTELMQSEVATLPCGKVFTMDFVVLKNGSVAKVVDFFQLDGDLLVRLEPYERDDRMHSLHWRKSSKTSFVEDATSIVEPVPWYSPKPIIFVIAMPLVLEV